MSDAGWFSAHNVKKPTLLVPRTLCQDLQKEMKSDLTSRGMDTSLMQASANSALLRLKRESSQLVETATGTLAMAPSKSGGAVSVASAAGMSHTPSTAQVTQSAIHACRMRGAGTQSDGLLEGAAITCS